MDRIIAPQNTPDKQRQQASTLNTGCPNACVFPLQPRRYISLIPLVIIAVIAMFYASTIREGHTWGDDFALYVLHAENIAVGKAYAQTPYVHNTLYPDIGPKAYPPILPIALAPIYKFFGLNLTAMKIVLAAFFLGALWAQFSIYRLNLPWPSAAALLLLVGANPYYWNFKDEILSDFPFLFFVWLTLYALHRYYDHRVTDRFSGTVSYAILVGTFMYLAYGTRVIGAVLPASLLLYELVKYRRLSRFAIIAVLAASVLIVAQTTLLPDAGSGYLGLYKQHTTWDIAKFFLQNVITYLTGLATFLDNGYSKIIEIVFFVIVSLLAVFGLIERLKNGITILEVFISLYVVVLVTAPFQAFRYLFPIIPIYFFYACLGASIIGSSLRYRVFQHLPIGMLAGLLALSYASTYTTLDYGRIQEGITRQESKDLFQYVQTHTKVDDVIVFRKPRAFALMTGRRTSIYPMPSADSSSWDREAWDYFLNIDARYLVVGASAWVRNTVPIVDVEWERQFVERCKQMCEQVFSNADFQVYELKHP